MKKLLKVTSITALSLFMTGCAALKDDRYAGPRPKPYIKPDPPYANIYFSPGRTFRGFNSYSYRDGYSEPYKYNTHSRRTTGFSNASSNTKTGFTTDDKRSHSYGASSQHYMPPKNGKNHQGDKPKTYTPRAHSTQQRKINLDKISFAELKKNTFTRFANSLSQADSGEKIEYAFRSFKKILPILIKKGFQEAGNDQRFKTLITVKFTGTNLQLGALRSLLKDWDQLKTDTLKKWQTPETQRLFLKGKTTPLKLFLAENTKLLNALWFLKEDKLSQSQILCLFSEIDLMAKNKHSAFFSARQTLSGTTEQVLGYNFGRHAVQTRLVGFTGKTDASNTKLMDTTYNFTAGKGYGFIRSQFASGSKALEVAGFDAHNTNFLTMQSVGYVYGAKAFQPFMAANYLTVSSKVRSAFGNHTSKTNTVFGVQAGVQSDYALTKNLSFKGFAMWQGNLNTNGAITKQLGANMMKVDAGLHYSKNNINAGVGYSVSHFGKTRHGFNLKLGVSF